jgi:hypothetical protein
MNRVCVCVCECGFIHIIFIKNLKQPFYYYERTRERAKLVSCDPCEEHSFLPENEFLMAKTETCADERDDDDGGDDDEMLEKFTRRTFDNIQSQFVKH